jgi:hypothetical protein
LRVSVAAIFPAVPYRAVFGCESFLSRVWHCMKSAWRVIASRGVVGANVVSVALNPLSVSYNRARLAIVSEARGLTRTLDVELGRWFQRLAVATYFVRYDLISQGVNLHRQVSFRSGSLAAQTACGPSVF